MGHPREPITLLTLCAALSLPLTGCVSDQARKPASAGTNAPATPIPAPPAEERVVYLGAFPDAASALAAAKVADLKGTDIATCRIAGIPNPIDAAGTISPVEVRKPHPLATGQLPRPPQPPPDKK